MINHSGIVHRATGPKWAVDPTSGEGAKKNGGRFNRKGQLALYTSLEESTAVEEFRQGSSIVAPYTMTSLVVDCDHIIDLTDPAELNKRRINLHDLDCPWALLEAQGTTPASWKLADTLTSQGYAGMIIQSFAGRAFGKGRNLVLWKWDAVKPYRVEKYDPHNALPVDQKSFAP